MDQQSNTVNQNPTLNSSTQINFAQLAKIQLKQYEDIEYDDFFVNEEDSQIKVQADFQSYMSLPQNHPISHYIPIGTNFQADMPAFMTPQAYKIKTQQQMSRLAKLKLHDPYTHEQFYYQNSQLIQQLFGKQRTYEDAITIFNCFRQCKFQCSFEIYIKDEKNNKFWEKYFKEKQKANQQKIKKKKKKRGTIPV